MRPLQQDLAPEPFAVYEADRVMSVIGPFCSLCERPIPERPSMWDSVRDVLVPRIADPMPGAMLMLCVNCADWQQRSAGSNVELLLPQRATTFRANGDSPYRYTLETVILRIIDDDHPVETRSAQAAIVTGTTWAAANTIERFRLNTPYYDASTKTMTIPRADLFAGTDRRVDVRTAAWQRAESVVPIALAARENRALAGAFETVRHIIDQTGFWSAWLTVLWAAAPERDRVVSLFAPPLTAMPLHRGTSLAFLPERSS